MARSARCRTPCSKSRSYDFKCLVVEMVLHLLLAGPTVLFWAAWLSRYIPPTNRLQVKAPQRQQPPTTL